jgi:hypothetical protein
MDCINCSHCGYPHLDLREFARKPHRKHFCANCGRDSTWSKSDIISTPLQRMHDRYAKTLTYETPGRTLNLDEHPDFQYTIWASTPPLSGLLRARKSSAFTSTHSTVESELSMTRSAR